MSITLAPEYANILAINTNMNSHFLDMKNMEEASKYYSLPVYKREQRQDIYIDIYEEEI